MFCTALIGVESSRVSGQALQLSHPAVEFLISEGTFAMIMSAGTLNRVCPSAVLWGLPCSGTSEYCPALIKSTR